MISLTCVFFCYHENHHDIFTFSSLMATQESWGKLWSIGTRNWKIVSNLKLQSSTSQTSIRYLCVVIIRQIISMPWVYHHKIAKITKTWRHPDQWQMRSIMQIRLKIFMNTPIDFSNWKDNESIIIIMKTSSTWNNTKTYQGSQGIPGISHSQCCSLFGWATSAWQCLYLSFVSTSISSIYSFYFGRLSL